MLGSGLRLRWYLVRIVYKYIAWSLGQVQVRVNIGGCTQSVSFFDCALQMAPLNFRTAIVCIV